MNVENSDVIIIGGGVAGISAALWCHELGLNSILLESSTELGGQLLWTYNAIENHLGVEAKNGTELRDIFVKQTENRNFSLRLNTKISKIDLQNRLVSTENGDSFSAKSLIIATGVKRRTLGIEGEERFKNKGIIKSGKKDKELVRDKNVLIIGGGDAALENALILSETASKVYVAHRRNEFRAREEFTNKAERIANVQFLKETDVRKIDGDEKIEAVLLEHNNKFYSLSIDAILFRIGVEPNTSIVKERLELDKAGYIKINDRCETNIEGIFAVGDVANPTSPTISSAIGMGTTAVKTIYEWLK